MHRWIPHVVHLNMWYQCFFLHAQKCKAHLGSLQLEAEGKWGMVILSKQHCSASSLGLNVLSFIGGARLLLLS